MQQTHDFGATLQFGVVSAVDEAGHNLRVKIPALEDMETDWLPMTTPAAGANQFYSLPDEGEQVVCLLDARGENGCVIGAIYSTADKPPASSKDKWVRRFKNGTIIEHDRKTGDVLVQTEGTVTIDAPNTEIKGNATVHGLLTYLSGMSAGNGNGGSTAQISGNVEVEGDVVINGISFLGHLHTGDSGGKTGKPE
ncbi:phage baseplate assembly protein V [Neisseria musculi]|uniref:Phage baseplate assembly V family protein n=1 Tax=Neisseria musculi TaxID=1815583 RepID=A0A7H1MEU6_9NEIS|nr:phage baseplate assembly protein V [Neisseria musculi]QNT60161.1 phage baseplate assembly V family protein [Neisseria musculi]